MLSYQRVGFGDPPVISSSRGSNWHPRRAAFPPAAPPAPPRPRRPWCHCTQTLLQSFSQDVGIGWDRHVVFPQNMKLYTIYTINTHVLPAESTPIIDETRCFTTSEPDFAVHQASLSEVSPGITVIHPQLGKTSVSSAPLLPVYIRGRSWKWICQKSRSILQVPNLPNLVLSA